MAHVVMMNLFTGICGMLLISRDLIGSFVLAQTKLHTGSKTPKTKESFGMKPSATLLPLQKKLEKGKGIALKCEFRESIMQIISHVNKEIYPRFQIKF